MLEKVIKICLDFLLHELGFRTHGMVTVVLSCIAVS